MAGPVRSHRRTSPVVAGLVALGSIVVVCGAGATAVAVFAEAAKGLAIPATLVAPLVLAAGFRVRKRWKARRRDRAHRELGGWAPAAGWVAVPADSVWPWSGLQFEPQVAVVLSAYTRRIGGFPVTAGGIRWRSDGLGTTVERPAGEGLFVLVELPQPVPSMAVRCRRALPRRRAGEDEFRRRFETRGFDSYRLDSAELRAAHVAGDVPLWTVIGRDLFAFVPLDRPVTPAAVELAVERTLWVVRLMEFGPDGPVALDATGPSPAH